MKAREDPRSRKDDVSEQRDQRQNCTDFHLHLAGAMCHTLRNGVKLKVEIAKSGCPGSTTRNMFESGWMDRSSRRSFLPLKADASASPQFTLSGL